MRKNMIICAVIAPMFLSCTDRFERLNTNPNQVTSGQMEAKNYRTGTKVLALQSLVVPVEEHQYQFIESLSGGPFGGYVGSTVDTWQTRFETFNPSTDWRKATFSDIITELYAPYRGIVGGTEDEVARAFASLFRVAVMQRLTDNYGPIPYGDILKTEKITVKYDSQETVYNEMFEELDDAIEAFSSNVGLPSSGWSTYDRVYSGNISQWLKYANSLKLRMAMRISYRNPELARRKAEEAVSSGLILSNEDNAFMKPTENRMPLIYNSWNDHRVGADILCFMTGYNDPRLEKMFLKSTGDNPQYVGIRIGSTVSKKSEAIDAYSNLIVNSDSPILWMNAAEVNFLLAEYQLRFAGDKAKAKEYYENGIRLSFLPKKAHQESTITLLMPAAHFGFSILTRWENIAPRPRRPSARLHGMRKVTKRLILSRLSLKSGLQYFLLETRLGRNIAGPSYPKLLPAPQNLGPDNVDLNNHARRLTYPVEEYSGNGANLSGAISMLNSESSEGGGDSFATRVWWDCKSYNSIKQ